jgi:hypothetical protein
MLRIKDLFCIMFSERHGKYTLTDKQKRVLDETMDTLCTACLLDAIKEWDALNQAEVSAGC